MTFQLILSAVKSVLARGSAFQAMLEAAFAFDFKIGDMRESLMRICFSPLAFWPIILWHLLLLLLPIYMIPPLHQLLSEQNSFVLFLLDASVLNMALLFIVFFIAEWVFRNEFLFAALVIWLLHRFEIHIALGTAALAGIYLSRICYAWWAVLDVSGAVRHVWNRAGQILLASWVLIFTSAFIVLDYLLSNYLLTKNTWLTRPLFAVAVVVAYHVTSQILLSAWGHFYFKKLLEPSRLQIQFSTAHWLLRFKISRKLQAELTSKTKEQLKNHVTYSEQLQSLKSESSTSPHIPFEPTLKKELEHLRLAQQRLELI